MSNVTTAHPLPPGLYLVSQYREDKGVEHTGILDVGNRLHLNGLPRWWSDPVVIHQHPTGLRFDLLSTTGEWKVLGVSGDEAATIARIHEARKNSNYDLFLNNCEHFTEFVLKGVRQSPQLQKSVLVVLGIVFGVWALGKIKPSTT